MRSGNHLSQVHKSRPEQCQIKTIYGEDKEAVMKGERVFIDKYIESRQLDSYYRIRYVSKEGVIKKFPAVYLAKASNENSITFGDHKKDETMFETEEEKNIIEYKDYGVSLTVKNVGIKVLVTISGGENLVGSWFIERKSSKPLSSFRRIKSITDEDKELSKVGEHVHIDNYPESRKLDAYYRLLVVLEDGEFLEFPSVLLPRTSNGRK